jgi:hypothetical protein
MKISFVINSDFFLGNRIFAENDILVNRDDCQRQWIELKKELLILGIKFDTYDISPIDKCDLVLFLNTPDANDVNFKKALLYNKPCYLVINELELIHTSNANFELHSYFLKIFTYQNRLIDNIKYFKLNYSFNFENIRQFRNNSVCEKDKLFVMVAGNKSLNHIHELYSERIKTIRWFEKFASSDFDLFGVGWNSALPFYRKFFTKSFKLYRGAIESKVTTISHYKFNFCYENAVIDGWITEKLFDSYSANSVPIYWGCSSISKFVNEHCYIDRSKFKSNKELYNYIVNLSDIEYDSYQENINIFIDNICNDVNYEFSISYFINTVINQINKDFNYGF